MTITVALFGLFGPSWKVCWLCKHPAISIERHPYRQKSINCYLGGRTERNSHGKKRIWMKGCDWSECQDSDAKIKIYHFSFE